MNKQQQKSSVNKKISSAVANPREDVAICLIGPQGCGKSALMVKYITRRFIGEYDPYFEGCCSKHETIDGIDLNVQVLDTYDRDKINLEKYMKWSDAIIIVYSITSSQSFLEVNEYLESIIEIIKKMQQDITTLATASTMQQDTHEKSFISTLKVVLLGNKLDMERFRQVNKQDVESLICKYSSYNTDTSSKTESFESVSSDTQLQSQSLIIPNISLHLTHMETTVCEEYEIVQNLFHTILKDIIMIRKRDRIGSYAETSSSSSFLLSNNSSHIQEDATLPSTPPMTTASSKLKAKLTSSNKRNKSPKSNSQFLVKDLNQNNITTSNDFNYTTQVSTTSSRVTNNSLNSNVLNTASSHSRNSSPNLSNVITNFNTINNSTPSSTKESPATSTKKNSSKFPFFTKILNK